MDHLKSTIETIEALLVQDTTQSLTYAALECRLAIEAVCYTRLQIAHDYISHDDLRDWRPAEVVNTLLTEVDRHIASGLRLSISSKPVDKSAPPGTAEDYEKMEWVEVGTQAGLAPKKLSRIWNALSGVALHVRAPKSRDDYVSTYGDKAAIRKQVEQALVEIRRLATGNLLTSGMGPEVSFTCKCGRLNKRRSERLKHEQTVRCVGVNCDHSYTVSIDGEDISFTAREKVVTCECGKEIPIPVRMIERTRTDQPLNIECECGHHSIIVWRPMLAKFKRKEGDPPA